MNKAYGEGWRAYVECKWRSDCPYPERSVERADWLRGWDAAKQQFEKM